MMMIWNNTWPGLFAGRPNTIQVFCNKIIFIFKLYHTHILINFYLMQMPKSTYLCSFTKLLRCHMGHMGSLEWQRSQGSNRRNTPGLRRVYWPWALEIIPEPCIWTGSSWASMFEVRLRCRRPWCPPRNMGFARIWKILLGILVRILVGILVKILLGILVKILIVT